MAIGQNTYHGIELFLEEPGHHANHSAHHNPDGHRQQTDMQRDASPIDHPSQDIQGLTVSTQGVLGEQIGP